VLVVVDTPAPTDDEAAVVVGDEVVEPLLEQPQRRSVAANTPGPNANGFGRIAFNADGGRR